MSSAPDATILASTAVDYDAGTNKPTGDSSMESRYLDDLIVGEVDLPAGATSG